MDDQLNSIGMDTMNKRTTDRIPVNFKANIFSGGKIYTGFIENVSDDGLEYLSTSFDEASNDLIPEKNVLINLQDSSGEILYLNCEVRWYSKTSPYEKLLTMGMKIIDPPEEYEKLINNLNIRTNN